MSNTPIGRRRARLARQQDRLRQLDYCARQGGTWALDAREEFERESIIRTINRARKAQQRFERRADVQLELAEVA